MSFGDEEVVSWLQRSGAQHDVVSWAGQHASTWSAFWRECPRGDWLLGIAVRAGVRSHDVVDAALRCVDVLTPYLPQNEPAIDQAFSLIREHRKTPRDAGESERVAHALDALLTRCTDPSAHAAVFAVSALVAAVDDRSAAATFITAIVQAAVMDAGDCGMMQAARFTEHECAQRVREAISLDVIGRALCQA